MANNQISITARQGIPELTIYGEIKGGTVAEFSKAWKSFGFPSRANVRISSPGGDCFAGAAIHDMLANSSVDITIYIDGLAASMASFIAMAGRRIIIGENAQMMIHNPAGSTSGGSGELNRMAALLESIGSQMMRVYARRSKQSETIISEWMAKETWFDASAAVAAGLADEVAGDLKLAASAFDLSVFRHAPAEPKSMQDVAAAYWAQRKGTAIASTGIDDISDLVPKPDAHAEVWSRFNRLSPSVAAVRGLKLGADE